ncbi:unnamed protein product [Meloidogyne enterolobii]|uniref:Uncharacterized protein n=1 Tax=Meloidogyne enterolobii TaxID=390850 RepID=A0ACB1AHH3_MELEN
MANRKILGVNFVIDVVNKHARFLQRRMRFFENVGSLRSQLSFNSSKSPFIVYLALDEVLGEGGNRGSETEDRPNRSNDICLVEHSTSRNPNLYSKALYRKFT